MKRNAKQNPPIGSWDAADRSYGELVGEKGHYYHQALILPNALRLLSVQKRTSLLDLGCGNGVLARHIPSHVEYAGIDSAKGLIDQAKSQTQTNARFFVADATRKLPIQKCDFDCACLILSLQNMDNGKGAIEQARNHLKPGGQLLIVLNHPCFRIPRQSSWGMDEASKMQYRRINLYMSALKIPISMQPGKKENSSVTYSFHHPLSTYVSWLAEHGFTILAMEEWCSDKTSEGSKAAAEDRARREIPLFLALLGSLS